MSTIDVNRWNAKLLGWSPQDFERTAFDDQLVSSIRAAQERLKLHVDGICGRQTYAALLAERQRALLAGQATAVARHARAGVIAVCEAKLAWLRNIVDLPSKGAPDFETSRAAIDQMIRSEQGLGWFWEEPYRGNYEWCGAFVGFAWRAAGLKLELRKTYFSSTYRLDRYARYAPAFETTPNPRPAEGPFRELVELDEHSGPLDAWFGEGAPPRPGDILLVGGKNTAYGKHVTLVESYDPMTGLFTTLEGNATGPGPSGGARHGVIRTVRPVGLSHGAPPSRYHARRLIRVAPCDLAA